MKVLYSQLRELVPGLTAGAREVGESLTFTGFMMDSFTPVQYKGQPDWLIGLEVRQNRADCLSAIGVAREVAAYFGLVAVSPVAIQLDGEGSELDIKVEATKQTKRVLAVRLDGVKNGESPDWLKEYMAFYGLNSVNLLVDLSNYVMLLTGYPSHLIDVDKTKGSIVWSLNDKFDSLTTLFGTESKLAKNGTELIIRDEEKIIALAGIVGGREAAIDGETSSVIMEVAVYDRSIIRRNSRSLNIVTEASHRLEKELDPAGARYALDLLAQMVSQETGGKVVSHVYDYYPNPAEIKPIAMRADWPERFAGIPIDKAEVLRIFAGLGFTVAEEGENLLVTVPSFRTDIEMREDLVEEVIRIHGYDRIPSSETPRLEVVRDITPKNILLMERSRDILTTLGFDEILSWPLTQAGDNARVNHRDWNIIATQNSVNDLYPDLRQSMLTGLLNQLSEYDKKCVEFIDIFELGKVFGEKDGEYQQSDALGLLSTCEKADLDGFRKKAESYLRLIGLTQVRYEAASQKPAIANPDSCWDVLTGGEKVGILYKLIPQETRAQVYAAEFDIEKLTAILLASGNNPVVEITQKLIALDANVELGAGESITQRIEELRSKLDPEHVWSIDVADAFPLEAGIRYTVRATYMNLGDQEAKEMHAKAFGL